MAGLDAFDHVHEQRTRESVTSLGVPIVAADFAVMVAGVPTGMQPLGVNYDRNKSTAFVTAGFVDTEGQLPVVTAFKNYLRSTCGDDRKIETSIAQGDMNYYAANQPSYNLSVIVVPGSLPTTKTSQYGISGTDGGYLNDGYISGTTKTEREFPYTNWQCESIIQQDKLRVHLPIAGMSTPSSPPPASVYPLMNSVVATLGLGLATRIVRFKGTRIGRPPQLPAGADTIPISPQLPSPVTEAPPRATLLKSSFRPVVPTRTVDGNLIYSVDGEFLYAMPSNVVDLAGNLAQVFIGYNPWENPSTAKYDASQVLSIGIQA